MKTCPECGNESPNMAVVCIKCKYSYPVGYNTYTGPHDTPSKTITKRPTGSAFIKSGLTLIILSVIGPLFLMFFQLIPSWIPEPEIFALLGEIVSLGLLLFTIGQIQRAMWFLPGDDQK